MISAQPDSFRIIFLGTPGFAVASLDALIRNGFQVVAVVSAPAKPAGRGLEMHQPEVASYAIQNHLPLFQPEKLSDPAFLEKISALKADLQIVVAFRMMPEKLWNMPRLGTFNLHASLLPQYRGAAPINHAIINGEKETGVTTFFLKHEIDTGDILLHEKVQIGEDETAGALHDRLMMAGAALVVKTASLVRDGKINGTPQENIPADQLRMAPKIYKPGCRISWNNGSRAIHDFVRGLSPYPAAWTVFLSPDGKLQEVKVFKSEPVAANHEARPGAIDTDRKHYLHVYCHDGYVKILELQLAGKKRMSTGELLRGFKINEEWHAE